MLRCSPEAFAKCPTRHICGKIEDATFTEGSECDLFNQSVMNMPIYELGRNAYGFEVNRKFYEAARSQMPCFQEDPQTNLFEEVANV